LTHPGAAAATTTFDGVAASLVHDRLSALSDRYALPTGATERFETLLDLVAAEPASITTVRDPAQGADVHVADSLVALELDPVRSATRLADIGSGGGFPGLALAIALPAARVSLVESAGRKCQFLAAATQTLELDNVEVVPARAESWTAGIGSQDVVTARALAPLPVLVEYAAPLLRMGGTLVAWKGRLDAGEAAEGAAAAAVLGMERPQATRVHPYQAAEERHLYLSSKVSSTPNGYPRREGMARKRPLGTSTGR
jgi:16S rRNA (guanine527-N7)-methyltransferase